MFSKNFNLVDQAVAKGKTPNNETIGPNARANTDPKAFMNGWAAKLKDQPETTNFYNQAFSSKSAVDAQNKYASFGLDPQFSDPNDAALGKDFLNKYWQSAVLNDEEKIHADHLAFLVQQQPGEAVGGNQVAADKMKFAGSSSPSAV